MAYYTNGIPDATEAPLTTRYVAVDAGNGDAILMDRQTDTPVLTNSGRIYMAPLENVQWTADSMNLSASIAPEAAPVAPEEEVEVDGVPTVGAEIVEPVTGEVGVVTQVGPESFIARFGEGNVASYGQYTHAEYRSGAMSPNDPSAYEPTHAAPKPNPAALLHVATLPEQSVSPLTTAVLRIKTATENLADWERNLLGLPLAESESVPALDTYDFETGTPDGLVKPNLDLANAWSLGAYRSGARATQRSLRQAIDLVHNGEINIYKLTVLLDSAMRSLESAEKIAESENPYA